MFVYLLSNWDSDRDLYKIGVSKHEDVNTKRIKGLQTGNPSEIILLYKFESEFAYKIESLLHRYYNSQRVRGELFELNDEQLKEFKVKCQLFHDNFVLTQK
jgi:formyltetrahydrofolate synthetase